MRARARARGHPRPSTAGTGWRHVASDMARDTTRHADRTILRSFARWERARARGGSSRALGHPPVASARAHGPPGQPAHRAERARKPGRVRLKGPRSTIGEGLRQAATVGAAEPGGVRPNGPRSTLIG